MAQFKAKNEGSENSTAYYGGEETHHGHKQQSNLEIKGV